MASVLMGFVGVGMLVLGVRLVLAADSLFGAVGSAWLAVPSFVLLTSLVAVPRNAGAATAPKARTVMFEDEPARHHPRRRRRAGVILHVNFSLLGGWFAAVGVIGAIEQSWVWLALAAVPTVYFLGFPLLAALGRFRPGGTWITADRVVDVHFGLRSELRLRDVDTVTPWTDSVHLTPVAGATVEHRSLTPAWWRARRHPTDLVIHRDGEPQASRKLADEVRGLVTRARR